MNLAALFDCLCPTNESGEVCGSFFIGDKAAPFLENVRKRPGMFVGSAGASGVYHLLCDVLDLLVRLTPAHQATAISLELSKDWFVLRSNQLNSDPALNHWESITLPVVAALSKRFHLFLTAQNTRICHSYESGVYTGETLHPILENQRIELRVWPDPAIFTDCRIDYFALFARCHTLAALYPGLILYLSGDGQYNRFCFPEGLCMLLSGFGSGLLDSERENVLSFEYVEDGIQLRAAISKCAFPDNMLSFANGYPTPDGGTHVEGLRQGIIHSLVQSGATISGDPEDYVCRHFAFAVAVWLDHPSYAGSVKRRVLNKELFDFVANAVIRAWK